MKATLHIFFYLFVIQTPLHGMDLKHTKEHASHSSLKKAQVQELSLVAAPRVNCQFAQKIVSCITFPKEIWQLVSAYAAAGIVVRRPFPFVAPPSDQVRGDNHLVVVDPSHKTMAVVPKRERSVVAGSFVSNHPIYRHGRSELKLLTDITSSSQELGSGRKDFSLATYALFCRVPYPDEITAVTFNHNGSRVAVSTIRTFSILDGATGRKIFDIPKDVSYRAELNSLGTMFLLQGRWETHLADAANGNLIRTFDEVEAVRFSPQGSKLIVKRHRDPGEHLFDIATKRIITPTNDHARAYAFNNDETVSFVQKGEVGFIMLNQNFQGDFLADESKIQHALSCIDPISHALFNSSGSILVTVSSGHLTNSMRIWDVKTGKIIHTIEHNFDPYSINFSKDGTQIISIYYRTKSAYIWDIATGICVKQFKHNGYVDSGTFCGDGLVATSCRFAQRDPTANRAYCWKSTIPQAHKTLLEGKFTLSQMLFLLVLDSYDKGFRNAIQKTMISSQKIADDNKNLGITVDDVWSVFESFSKELQELLLEHYGNDEFREQFEKRKPKSN